MGQAVMAQAQSQVPHLPPVLPLSPLHAESAFDAQTTPARTESHLLAKPAPGAPGLAQPPSQAQKRQADGLSLVSLGLYGLLVMSVIGLHLRLRQPVMRRVRERTPVQRLAQKRALRHRATSDIVYRLGEQAAHAAEPDWVELLRISAEERFHSLRQAHCQGNLDFLQAHLAPGLCERWVREHRLDAVPDRADRYGFLSVELVDAQETQQMGRVALLRFRMVRTLQATGEHKHLLETWRMCQPPGAMHWTIESISQEERAAA